jgi:hypothetical protein
MIGSYGGGGGGEKKERKIVGNFVVHAWKVCGESAPCR